MLSRSDYWNALLLDHPDWLSSQDSPFNVALVTLIGPLCLLLRAFLRPRSGFNDKASTFLWDCLVFLVPITLTFTLWSSSLVPVTTGAVLVIALCFARRKGLKWPALDDAYPLKDYGIPHLNTYRALVNMCTIVVILAVDFSQIFPQRLHKRYTRGYSLMDTGVGSFVFSHAAVAPESRYDSIRASRLERIRNALVSSSALIVLGCARLFVTWITDYSVSEAEYGKHWNFFFTLATIKLLTTAVFCVLPRSANNYSWVLAACVGLGYQCMLSVWDYKTWIIEGDDGDGAYTGNFINSNRPGLFSSLGYCSLYLLGIQIGRSIFKDKPLWRDQLHYLLNHVLVIVTCAGVTWLLDTHVDKPSRMTANLTFVAWQIAHNVFLVSCSHAAELACAVFSTAEEPLIPGQCAACSIRRGGTPSCAPSSAPSCACLMSAVNKNQLFFFLVGNVLTGLVNITVKTGAVSDVVALGVLFLYGGVVCGTTVLLFVWNVSTKFW